AHLAAPAPAKNPRRGREQSRNPGGHLGIVGPWNTLARRAGGRIIAGGMTLDTLTIVGVGLIGGSVGLAARARGVARQVVGVGRSATTLDTALELGAITAGTCDLAGAARQADLILCCTPVDQIVGHVRAAAAACRPGT